VNRLPRPGASELENLVATLLLAGNTPENLNLETIAKGRRFGPDELLVEFRLQQNGQRKLPEEVAANSTKPVPVAEVEE
jgi:hypothetical protein